MKYLEVWLKVVPVMVMPEELEALEALEALEELEDSKKTTTNKYMQDWTTIQQQ